MIDFFSQLKSQQAGFVALKGKYDTREGRDAAAQTDAMVKEVRACATRTLCFARKCGKGILMLHHIPRFFFVAAKVGRGGGGGGAGVAMGRPNCWHPLCL